MDATSDDLTRPLGLAPPRPPRWARLCLPLAPMLGAALAVSGLAIGAFIALVDDPLGGEPHARVAIKTAPPGPPPAPHRQVREVPAEAGSRTANEVEGASGVSVVRGDGAGAPGSVVIRVPDAGPLRLQPAPDPRLVERSRHGPLPKVGAEGATPLAVYARPAAAALPNGAAPVARIAVIVGGLGISGPATAEAIAKLPAAASLAFAPYGAGLEASVAKAREDGHEVLLQIPMEPFDYPDNDPGPHTLLAKGGAKENLERLHWVMARFTGYAGLMSFMGAKLTSDEAALAPFLREAAGRGLGVIDDGSSPRSLLVGAARAAEVPSARADIVVDVNPRPDLIDRELARLEEVARRQGVALATASALPVTVDRLARWLKTLESRGILLVPATSVLAAPPRSAPRR